MPRPLSTEASLNISTIPLTLALRGSKLFVGAAQASASLPTGDDARCRTLIFVHGFRHRAEWRLHADVLGLSSSAPLISSSDLLLFTNDYRQSYGGLVAALRLYPQALRLLIRTAVNIGYRCGLLHSLAATQAIWHRYGSVISTHRNYSHRCSS